MTRFAPFAAAALALTLAGGQAFALDPRVEAGTKAFSAVAADAEMLKTYCAMSRAMSSASDESDSAKNEAADKEITGFMTKLGPDFQKAWDLGADLNPDSEDGKAMNAALDSLEEKCSQ